MADERFGTHENGKGRIFGFAEANAASRIDKRSSIHDQAEIYDSVLINTIVRGNARISNARLENCLVDGNAIITGGEIKDSTVCDNAGIYGRAKIAHSILLKTARVFDEASIFNVCVSDASIYGDAEIHSDTERLLCYGYFRIGTGKWINRLPRLARICALEISLTESNDFHAYIGCKRKPIKQWLKQGNRLGKNHGWTTDAVEIARSVLTDWLENPV